MTVEAIYSYSTDSACLKCDIVNGTTATTQWPKVELMLTEYSYRACIHRQALISPPDSAIRLIQFSVSLLIF